MKKYFFKILIFLILLFFVLGCINTVKVPAECKLKPVIEDVCSFQVKAVRTHEISQGILKGGTVCNYYSSADTDYSCHVSVSFKETTRQEFDEFIETWLNDPKAAPMNRTDVIGEIAYEDEKRAILLFFAENKYVDLGLMRGPGEASGMDLGNCTSSDQLLEIANRMS